MKNAPVAAFRVAALALAAALAACSKEGAVDEDAKAPPPLEEMQATPADWSSIDFAAGQRVGASKMLEVGPIVIDFNALLGPDAIAVRKRLINGAGTLERDGELLVATTPPGAEAAYLIVDPAQRALEVGWKAADGWKVRRTAAAEVWHPAAVEALVRT